MSKEKYGITDAHYLCDSAIFNTETDEILRLYQICDLLNEQDQKISDLEAKLVEAQKTIEIQRMSNDALIDENLDYRYDITDSAYEQAKYMAESWEEDYQQEIAELKQQLTEKEQTITNLVEDSKASKEFLKKQLAESEEEKETLRISQSSTHKTLMQLNDELLKTQKQLAEKDEQLNSAQVGEEFALNCCDEVNKLLALQVVGQHQDKISFAIEQLEKVKENIHYLLSFDYNLVCRVNEQINNQIRQLEEAKIE